MHNEGDIRTIVNCKGDNCTIGPVTGSGAAKSDSDQLTLGLSLGLGIPALAVAVLGFCDASLALGDPDDDLD